MDQGTYATALKVMRAMLISPKAAKVKYLPNFLYIECRNKISNCSNNFNEHIML
jgi:hypothetical protein